MKWTDREDWLAAANEAGVRGFLHPCECRELVRLAEGRDTLEIGAYAGLSAWCMAHSARTVTSVDSFRACTNGQDQMEELTTYQDFLAATRGFTNVKAVIETSAVAWRVLSRKRYDMIFIDASHSYKDVKADIGRWWGRVRPGGVLAIHDYGHSAFPGVKQAVDERFGDLGEYVPGTQNWVVTLRWEWK